MAAPPPHWLPAFLKFCSLITINSKNHGRVPLRVNGAQRRFLSEIHTGLEKDIHTFNGLKARQLGISTLLLALDVFWLYMFEGLQGALIYDNAKNTQQARLLLTDMLASVPPEWAVPIQLHNRDALVLANGSSLQYMSAGKGKNSGLGRSRALNHIHACVPGDTPVITADGKIKRMDEVRVGDRVLTHTGAETVVTDAWSSENDKGDLIKVTPWLGQAVCFTANHHVPTQRGVIDAKNLRNDDWLVMPIRPITQEVTEVTLPTGEHRSHGGGAIGIGSAAVVPLTEEFGFACGYYLAEGSMTWSNDRSKPGGVCFTRHRSETAYGDRAISALSGFTKRGSTRNIKNTLTSVDYAYGAPFARWIQETFGDSSDKRIPDDVFSWGEDFCRGLVAGLLCGDGSKTPSTVKSAERPRKPRLTRNGKPWGRPPTGISDPNRRYVINRVSLSSIRASLAVQARDLAASLGYGWASMSFRPGGLKYGRNCKDQWVVCWNGEAAARLMPLMGLPASPQGARSWVQRYKIEHGAVWLKIRKIESGVTCDRIYDLTVEHSDHTFRTPFMSIGNSEISSWGDQDGIDSLKAAMTDVHPDRLFLFESTALGHNVWFDMYEEGKHDPAQHSFFIGWWTMEDYQYASDTPLFATYWLAQPSLSEEEAIIQNAVSSQYRHDITPEQWAWYRHKSGGERTPSFLQEFPSTESESWQSTGHAYFPVQRITSDLSFLYEAGTKAGFLGFKYTYGLKFNDLVCEPVNNADDAELRLWEQPRVGGRYVIGMDVAYGRDPDNDRTVISVWRCYADKMVQVAEYATTEPTEREATWVLAHLAGCYQDCILNIEVNGPGGAVMNELKNLKDSIYAGQFREVGPTFDPKWTLDQARWFLYHRVDALSANYVYNTVTTDSIKERYCAGLRDGYKFEEVLVRSIPLLQEMSKFVRNGGRLEASGRNKDDRVMAGAMAHAAWSDHIRPTMRVQGMTYAVVTTAEKQVKDGALNVTEWIFRAGQEDWQRSYEERIAAQARMLEV